MKLIATSLFVLAVPFAIARADHGRHQPPQAAFDACAKSKAGDACEVTLHEHTLKGVCAQMPDRSALVCHPDHPHRPPPAAIDACNGRKSGDTCSVTFGDHTINGTCAQRPDGSGPLHCRPDHPLDHHSGHADHPADHHDHADH
jgi:hypothetical protein